MLTVPNLIEQTVFLKCIQGKRVEVILYMRGHLNKHTKRCSISLVIRDTQNYSAKPPTHTPKQQKCGATKLTILKSPNYYQQQEG